MVVGEDSPVAVAALLFFFPIALLVLGLSRSRAAIPVTALLLGGSMFLPERVGFDVPGLPVLGKEAVMNLSILAGLLLLRPRVVRSARPGTGLEILGLVLVAGGLVTTLTNTDPLHYGPKALQPIPLEDLRTASVTDLVRYALPVFLGRCAIRDLRDLRALVSLLAIAGLVYSLAVLVEIRLSPQLHRWVYGHHPAPFLTAERFGGYRPLAFMANGLAVSIFMATTLLAAVSLARARIPIRIWGVLVPSSLASVYLAFALVACKSLGSILVGAGLALSLALLRVRTLAALAAALACFVVLYPLLRAVGAVPVDAMIEMSRTVSEERAKSLGGRLDSEEQMLAKARQRLLFGWGGYERSWVFDPVTGRSRMVPDGFWIIVLSSRGLVGFGAVFGMYAVPVLLAARRLRRIPDARAQVLIAGVMLMVAMRMVDHLPNGFWGSLPLYLAGALYELQRNLPARPRSRSPLAPVARGTQERVQRAARAATRHALRGAPLCWPGDDSPRGAPR